MAPTRTSYDGNNIRCQDGQLRECAGMTPERGRRRPVLRKNSTEDDRGKTQSR